MSNLSVKHSLSVSPAKLRAARRNDHALSKLARVPARCGIRQAMTGSQRRRAFLVMRSLPCFAQCRLQPQLGILRADSANTKTRDEWSLRTILDGLELDEPHSSFESF
jgi:hypothetical protein